MKRTTKRPYQQPTLGEWERSWQKHWSKVGLPGYELPAGAEQEFLAQQARSQAVATRLS